MLNLTAAIFLACILALQDRETPFWLTATTVVMFFVNLVLGVLTFVIPTIGG